LLLTALVGSAYDGGTLSQSAHNIPRLRELQRFSLDFACGLFGICQPE
jgi:hypothetical protein